MKIGIFLGSFDPIHVGHIEIATRVLNDKLVDYVYFIPAVQNPWKDYKPAPFWDRVRLIQDALKNLQDSYYNLDGKRRIMVSDIESRLEEPVYSYQVLKKFTEYLGDMIFPGIGLEYYIICGSDVASCIKNWKEGNWILENFKIIEVDRPGFSSTSNGIEVSSTKIRNYIKDGLCPVPWITSENWSYILDHNLYK